MSGLALTRRQFLAISAAGGLSLAFHLPFSRDAIAQCDATSTPGVVEVSVNCWATSAGAVLAPA
jgi:hypothetical protein